MKRTILHIAAGDDNWTPTKRELTALANKFRRALKDATETNVPVVPTRNSVYPIFIEYDSQDSLHVSSLPTAFSNQGKAR
jgi:hypothetical protein